MRAHVLIGFLLACTAAGYPTEQTQSAVTFSTEELDQLTELRVYNDDGVPVSLDSSEIDNDDETETQTRKDLSNRVFFYIHTDKNPEQAQPLYLDDEEALKNSNFDPKKPTRIVTHGWINSRKSAACSLVRKAYIQHGNYNVIVIDWSSITFRPYVWATRRVLMVGQYVAAMLDFLVKHGLDLQQTTLAGHSLGAHVVGLAGHYAKGTVKYIVGLDPALPGFALAGPGQRISRGDAEHVEIIHTNAGVLGYLSAIGDTDFYPNGGSWQLGCLIDFGGSCSHARSYQLFAESINSPVGFLAYKCDSYLQLRLGLCKSHETSMMGGNREVRNERGLFYLKTRGSAPFAISRF